MYALFERVPVSQSLRTPALITNIFSVEVLDR
jgi:hypothetical protein